jgi:hypothetical protein
MDGNTTTCDHILQDLNNGKSAPRYSGARGMRADQVPHCMTVKTRFGLPCEPAAFPMVGSCTPRWFYRPGFAGKDSAGIGFNSNLEAVRQKTPQ